MATGASTDLRWARYRTPKARLEYVAIAATISLQRLTDWWAETPRVTTRTSRFAALVLSPPLDRACDFPDSITTGARRHPFKAPPLANALIKYRCRNTKSSNSGAEAMSTVAKTISHSTLCGPM